MSTQKPRAGLSEPRHLKISIRDLAVFAVFGAVMYISFVVTQGLPNIHLLGVFIGAATLVYRVRALIPLYIYIMLYGLFSGFSFWWMPYIYIWLPLWFAFMLVGKLKISKKAQIPLYMLICGLHGLVFGMLYAPAQALFFGLNLDATIAWIVAGLWFDIIHAASNFLLAALIVPLSDLLMKLSGYQDAAHEH